MSVTERQLSRTDIVVRGGAKRDVELIRDEIEQAQEQNFGPVLSISVDAQRSAETYEQALFRISTDGDIPHGQIQVSTVGELLDAGFSVDPYVEPGWAWNHCHVVFDDPVSQSQIEGFVGVLRGPLPNPTGGKKRKR